MVLNRYFDGFCVLIGLFEVSSSGWFWTSFSRSKARLSQVLAISQKLIALLALGHLLSKDAAFVGVFSVFGSGFHSRLYVSR